MVPAREFPYLNRAQQLLAARALPSRDKRRKYIHPSIVFEGTLKLLDRIEREFLPAQCLARGSLPRCLTYRNPFLADAQAA